MQLARISQQTKCIGAANQRKICCDKVLREAQEFPDADKCSTTLFEFAPVEDRKVVADFSGGR